MLFTNTFIRGGQLHTAEIDITALAELVKGDITIQLKEKGFTSLLTPHIMSTTPCVTGAATGRPPGAFMLVERGVMKEIRRRSFANLSTSSGAETSKDKCHCIFRLRLDQQ